MIAEMPGYNGVPIRVLLVDDDPDDHVLTRELLVDVEGVEFEVDSAYECSEGLEMLSRESYDVVLLDYHLGAETGLDFLGRLPLDEHTPVLLLTGQPDRTTDVQAMLAGASDYLVKSEATPTLLERTIRYVCENRRAEDARREAEFRFRMLVESAGAIVWQADPETLEFSMVSQEAEALLGYPVRRWIESAEFWPDHIHPEDRERVLRDCREATRRGDRHAIEYRMVAADGAVVWLRDIVRVVKFGGQRQIVGVMVDITEQKEAESTLRLRDRALGAISEGILITDPRQKDNGIVYVNRAFEELTGYQASEVVGRNCRFLQGRDSDPAVVSAMQEAVDGGRSFVGEIVNYRKDGTPFWNRLAFQPLFDEAGNLSHFVGVQQDVSERVRLTGELQTERAQLAAVFQQAPAFIATTRGPEHVFEMANPRFKALVGGRALSGKRLSDALPELTVQGIPQLLDGVYRTGESFVISAMPLMIERRAGQPLEERILDVVVQPLKDSDGSVVGLLVHGVDVSEEVRGKKRLKSAEEHYRRLVSSAPQGIYAVDVAGRFTEMNAAGAKLLGRPLASLIGQHFTSVIAPEDVEHSSETFQRMISGFVHDAEFRQRIRTPGGEKRLLQVTQTTIREGDAIVGVHGIARDITQERFQEQRMRLLATALDGLQEGVSVSTGDGEYLYANTAHARLLGYDPGTLSSIKQSDFVADQAGQEQRTEILSTARASGSWSGRIQARRKMDGQLITLDVLVGRIDASGEEQFFNIIQDATNAVARERQLRRTESLASVGTLLSGVAHELNNPLHSILNFAELLLRDERPDEEREDLDIIRREANRAAKIVSNLRLIARRSQEDEERDRVDLNEVVTHVLRLLEYRLRTSNISVSKDLADDLLPVWAVRTQIEQVVVNLVINAEQAMSTERGEGMLTIRTVPSLTGVALYVADNGPGIRPENLDRIFDAFWTTKPPGEGTGLGLSLVNSIVTEHGGTLRVESAVGTGAVFVIDLPRAAEGAGRPTKTEVLAAPDRPLRLLVVDDEPALRRSLQRYLSSRGHTVEVASEGRQALKLLSAARTGYDGILSDLKMPGMGGLQFLERLREMPGGLENRLVFLTGDAAGGGAARLLVTSSVPLLLKPVRLEEVAYALERRAASADSMNGGAEGDTPEA